MTTLRATAGTIVRRGFPAMASLVLLSAWAAPASAQLGYGYGIGWGGLFNQPTSQQTANYVNQRSLIREQAAAAAMPQPLSEPRFQVRDDSFFTRYDLATREAMVDRVARYPSAESGTPRRAPATAPNPNPPTPPTPPAAPRTVKLANFFDPMRHLVWPAGSPIEGDLADRRAEADKSALAVLDEYQSHGAATLATATKARQQLIDYGRPALASLRAHTTPAIADSFHAFLLSLYSELGDAYTIPMSSR